MRTEGESPQFHRGNNKPEFLQPGKKSKPAAKPKASKKAKGK